MDISVIVVIGLVWSYLIFVGNRRCTIKIKLLGFSKFLYHCFLETVRIFTVPNLSYLFGIISEFRQGAKIGDARLWEQKYV